MRIVPALVIAALLAACGQTGDLYLPGKTPPPSTPPVEDQNKKKDQPPPVRQPAPPQPG
jgi:predicted small lipoprotein YifL